MLTNPFALVARISLVLYCSLMTVMNVHICHANPLFSLNDNAFDRLETPDEDHCESKSELDLMSTDCEIRISDPCICRNNATSLSDGQLNDTIIVAAPAGQTWRVQQNTGLYQYDADFSQQMTTLIPVGTVLPELRVEGTQTLYYLIGVHTEGEGYNIELSNGVETLDTSNICFYPNPMIIDLSDYVCTQSPVINLNSMADQIGTADFYINGIAETAFDPMALGSGDHIVRLDFTADRNTDPANFQAGCLQSVTQEVEVDDDPDVACIKNINVTLRDLCSIEITPQMVQAADPCMSPGSYELRLYDQDTVRIADNTIRAVGVYIAEVINTSTGAYCWGHVHADDKTAPIVSCPADIVIDCDDSLDPSFTGYPSAVENCSALDTSFMDVPDLTTCGTGMIERIWTVTDEYGNSDTCTQLITIRETGTLRVNWPDDLTVHCPRDSASLHPDQLPRRYARPRYNPGCRDLGDHYTDELYEVCYPGGLKILRNWVIRDWCDPSAEYRHTQTIKVIDTIPPTIDCPENQIVSIGHEDCTVRIPSDRPIVSDLCDPDPTIIRSVMDENNQLVTSSHVGPGDYIVSFRVMDACGNETLCSYQLTVEDLVAPVPICDQNTVLSLNNQGRGELCYTSIDDHSSDNCQISDIEIKLEGESDARYRDCITFDCSHLGVNKVHLRARDIYGNSNTCWANVRVEDKSAPQLICPADITVHCDQDLNDLSVLGNADVTNNCENLIPEYEDVQTNSHCSTGLILRNWRVEKTLVGHDGMLGTADDQIKISTCTQRIEIIDTSKTEIYWPSDLEIECTGGGLSLGPLDLVRYNNGSSFYDRPEIVSASCANLGIRFTDQRFDLCGGGSFKIRRTWFIEDWCTDLDTSHQQLIWVKDVTPPVLEVENVIVDIISNEPACAAFVHLQAEASDDCTGVSINNNSPYASSGFEDASGIYPKGRTTVLFTVYDGCGNKTTKEVTVNVRDRKKPQAICGPILGVNLKATGQVSVCAELFNNGSKDNCTDDFNLKYFIQKLDDNGLGIGDEEECLVYTCDEYILSPTQHLRLIVEDADGNRSYCRTQVVLQDNDGFCPEENEGGRSLLSVAGSVIKQDDNELEDFQVYFNNSMIAEHQMGQYAIDSIPQGSPYKIHINHPSTAKEELSTLDLISTKRHILELQFLESPYQLLAADVNLDSKITTLDLVEMKNVILSRRSSYSSGKVWHFIPQSHEFSEPSNPWQDPFESFYQGIMRESSTDMNFRAIKLGNVDGTYSNSRDEFEYVELKVSQDKNVLNFYLDDYSCMGGQIAIFVDSRFRVETFSSAYIGADDYHIESDQDGTYIHLLWDESGYNFEDFQEFFSVEFSGSSAEDLQSAIDLSTEKTLRSEIYCGDYDLHRFPLQLVWVWEEHKFALFQNTPNPFQEETEIKFSIPSESYVSLEIFDVSGRKVWNHASLYEAGMNSMVIKTKNSLQPGMYFYTLSSDNYSATKRLMIY